MHFTTLLHVMYYVFSLHVFLAGRERVGGQRRKGSEWWNEEVGRAVAEKKRAFEE